MTDPERSWETMIPQSAPGIQYSVNAFSQSINLSVSGLVKGHYEMHCSHSLSDARRGCVVSIIKSLSDKGSWQGFQSSLE